MASRSTEYVNLINTGATLLWRHAPAALLITGPWQLLYPTVDSDEKPNTDPDINPWGRLTVQLTSSRPTNIKQTKYEVKGTLVLQVMCRKTRGDAQSVVTRIVDYFVDNIKQSIGKPMDLSLTNIRRVDRAIDNGNNRCDFMLDFSWYERRN